MSLALYTAVISAATSILVVLIGQWLNYRIEKGKERRSRANQINSEYINPLRLQVAEAAFRNAQFGRFVEERSDNSEFLSPVDQAADVSQKDAGWYTGIGCYLVSTAYITACLFAEMARLRSDYAHLRLDEKDQDTRLAGLLLRVNLAFLRDQGVYYVLQGSIGKEMVCQTGNCEAIVSFASCLRTHRLGFG